MKRILLKFSVFMVTILLSLLLVAPALIYADPVTIPGIVGVTAPVTGGTPVSTITATAEYTGTVAWLPADDPFLPGTAYTATITLTAIPPVDFTAVTENYFTVAGATATNAAGSGVITAAFPATADAVIDIAAIPGVTAPVTGGTPVAVITETAQYTGTVTWLPADDPFAPGTAYTATITLTPKTGYTLTGVTANFFTVIGATATNDAGSGVVTADFPATADAVIDIAAIPGVTAPVIGGTPVAVITETAQYTGTVAWLPADNPFLAATAYTATITLTPKTGYTLTGVTANFFTVIGATATNAAGSGVVAAAFPATAAESLVITAIGQIIGTPQVGVELTAGALTPAGANATYQWQIDLGGGFVDIVGATFNKYTPVAGDLGGIIRVIATGTAGDTGTATSDPTTTAVAAAAATIPTVPLGTTSTFAILAYSLISDAGGASSITGAFGGDVGLSPSTGAGIGLLASQVSGTIYSVDAAGPVGSVINPALLTIAKNDLVAAYNNAAGRTPTDTFTGDNALGGKTLTSGVYRFESATTDLVGTLTLDAQGDPNAVFIFQATSSLTTASASSVNLINGARFCRVFWVVPSSATLGSGSTFVGHIFALTSISVNEGATIYGQLLARNGAVTLINDTITNGPCDTVVAAAAAAATAAATERSTTATTGTPVTETVTGGTLPRTSTPWYNILLAGVVLALIGSVSWWIARKRFNV